VGAELFHADGRSDMKKLIVAFRNIADTPKSAYRVMVYKTEGKGTQTWIKEKY